MNKTTQKQIHAALLRIREKPALYYGICRQVDDLCPDINSRMVRFFLGRLFPGWPHYSGSRNYPVPDPEKRRDPLAAWKKYDHTGEMWDERTEYGRLRRDLLDYLIKRTAP